MESWGFTSLHLGDKRFGENEKGCAGSRNLTEVLSCGYVIIGIDVYRRELKCGIREKNYIMLSLGPVRLNPT